MRTPLVIITILLAALCGFAVLYTQSVVHRGKLSPTTASNSSNAQQPPRSDAKSKSTSPSTTPTTQPTPPKPIINDLDRVATAMIESNRPNPYFGEWSHRYLIIRDVLRADVNDDSWLTNEDFRLFIVWFDSSDPCADFNQDGVINGQDMSDFITSYQFEELGELPRDAPREC
jgi:hypothetical protein